MTVSNSAINCLPGSQLLDEFPQLREAHQRTQDAYSKVKRFAVGKPSAIHCSTHRFTRLVDWDASARQTHLSGKPILEYTDCPGCKKSAAIAGRSDWLRSIGVPRNLLHCTFEGYGPINESQNRAFVAAGKYAKRKKGCLALGGSAKGTGKTHLAVSILRECGKGRFISQARLMTCVSERYDDRNRPDVVCECEQVSLLVIDDLGISRGGADVETVLHRILTHRYDEGLPTIITSNLTIHEFSNVVGDRMMDRFREYMEAYIEVEGQSQRHRSPETGSDGND